MKNKIIIHLTHLINIPSLSFHTQYFSKSFLPILKTFWRFLSERYSLLLHYLKRRKTRGKERRREWGGRGRGRKEGKCRGRRMEVKRGIESGVVLLLLPLSTWFSLVIFPHDTFPSRAFHLLYASSYHQIFVHAVSILWLFWLTLLHQSTVS